MASESSKERPKRKPKSKRVWTRLKGESTIKLATVKEEANAEPTEEPSNNQKRTTAADSAVKKQLHLQAKTAWTWIKGDNPIRPKKPPSKAWVWIKGDNPIKPHSKTELAIQQGMDRTWTWIKGDNPITPPSKARLAIQHRRAATWTWIKGDNPVKPKKERKVPRAGAGVRNQEGKLIARLKGKVPSRLPDLKEMVGKLKVGTRKKKGGGNEEENREPEERAPLGGQDPHDTSVESEGASSSGDDEDNGNGTPPPDYISQAGD